MVLEVARLMRFFFKIQYKRSFRNSYKCSEEYSSSQKDFIIIMLLRLSWMKERYFDSDSCTFTCNFFRRFPKITLARNATGAIKREESARKRSNTNKVIKLEVSCTIKIRMDGIVPEIPLATASVSLVSRVIRSPVWYLLTESQFVCKIFSYTFLRIPKENFSLITTDTSEVRIVIVCETINTVTKAAIL